MVIKMFHFLKTANNADQILSCSKSVHGSTSIHLQEMVFFEKLSNTQSVGRVAILNGQPSLLQQFANLYQFKTSLVLLAVATRLLLIVKSR